MKYRKKPIVVEACPFLPTHAPHDGCTLTSVVYERNYASDTHRPVVQTANGPVTIQAGAWIVRDPSTWDTWPVAADIFAATYEPADDSAPQGTDEAGADQREEGR